MGRLALTRREIIEDINFSLKSFNFTFNDLFYFGWSYYLYANVPPEDKTFVDFFWKRETLELIHININYITSAMSFFMQSPLSKHQDFFMANNESNESFLKDYTTICDIVKNVFGYKKYYWSHEND